MSDTTRKNHWVWMDLEMTGLDDTTCTILQVATIITDEAFNEVAEQDVVIWHPESALETMSPFVRNMHTKNGLLDRVRKSETPLDEAESEVLALLAEHVPYRKGILCGNSIWQDRRFLLRYMPLLEKYLHYRMLDVSSFKIATSAWYGDKGIPPAKKNTHDALDDIRESIEEMKFYRDNLMGPRAS